LRPESGRDLTNPPKMNVMLSSVIGIFRTDAPLVWKQGNGDQAPT